MGIKCTTHMETVLHRLERGADGVTTNVERAFLRAGEAAVRGARNPLGRDYTDRTGSLRASTGYVLTRDGAEIRAGGFTKVDGKGEDGTKAGRAHAEELAGGDKSPDTITLHVTTGMSYARYVDARGYDVLDTAERAAVRALSKHLTKRGNRK